jgi:mono/diheme cytochrome c family protein
MSIIALPRANANAPVLALLAAIIAPQIIVTPAYAQSANSQVTELVDPVAASQGKQYFDRACTYCHGKEGAGGKTPSFKGRKDFTAQNLSDAIANGRVSGANIMPAWKGSLTSTQISQLVAYILTLASQPVEE